MKRQDTKKKEWLGGRHEEAQTIGGGSGAGPGKGPCPSSWQGRMKEAPGPLWGWQRRDRGAEEFGDSYIYTFKLFGGMGGSSHW